MDISHLYVGQPVRIGGKHAHQFSYASIVGEVAVIRELKTHHTPDSTGHRQKKTHPTCLVRIEKGWGSTWYVQSMDCIPVKTTNKTNAHLLSQDFH